MEKQRKMLIQKVGERANQTASQIYKNEEHAYTPCHIHETQKKLTVRYLCLRRKQYSELDSHFYLAASWSFYSTETPSCVMIHSVCPG